MKCINDYTKICNLAFSEDINNIKLAYTLYLGFNPKSNVLGFTRYIYKEYIERMSCYEFNNLYYRYDIIKTITDSTFYPQTSFSGIYNSCEYELSLSLYIKLLGHNYIFIPLINDKKFYRNVILSFSSDKFQINQINIKWFFQDKETENNYHFKINKCDEILKKVHKQLYHYIFDSLYEQLEYIINEV